MTTITKKRREQIPWNKGKKVSAEIRAKIIAGLTGRPVSEETRAKIRAKLSGPNGPLWGKPTGRAPANKGKKVLPDIRAKIIAGLIGRPVSEATREKMGAALRGPKSPFYKKPGWGKSGPDNPHYGKPGPAGWESATWIVGRIMSSGYRKIWKRTTRPDADSKGYIMEHRLVAEAVLGRRLGPKERVCRVNRDRLDNRPENLIVCYDLGYHVFIRHHDLGPEDIDPGRGIWLGKIIPQTTEGERK
jgi:hypothetical protein